MNLNFAEMLKNIGGIKEQVEAIRERVSRMHITGEAGGGMVKVTVTGEGVVTDIHIEKELLGSDGKEMIEELVISAVNDAMKKAKEAMAYELKKATGMNSPGIDKLFGG
jgi:DNA-binding YbaB/EbfC family protein